MNEPNPFNELLARVRGGDADAAEELVRRYEPAIRVAVRTRLSDPALRRQFDSMDICQSVLASFFLRAGAGQYDLHDAAQLVALLTKMAQNKLAMHIRHEFRQRRDIRRATSLPDDSSFPAAVVRPPSEQAANRDLLDQAYALMEPDVRQIADCRGQGVGWPEIAERLGGTPDARRKQFQRAMDRIARTLAVE